MNPAPRVAIVDYGLGNLYSVSLACEHVGLQTCVTSSPREILRADAVVLPGVGAFGDAMATLRRLDLVGVLRDIAASGTPLVGICLGAQLLMSESHEFGRHKGLGVFEGSVVPFVGNCEGDRRLKVPHVGWTRIIAPRPGSASSWVGTPLDGLKDGEQMYFVHSYVLQPSDQKVVLSNSTYGQIEFCSSMASGSIFACQFHPERSGPKGLRIYGNIAARLERHANA